ncbi:MAG TPA: Flp1 family type IVb pilin [Bacillota bacterium]|nr:Flp1 family type IVb pilin [Bacillota bacterium]HPE38459.1 Flp1 family type IVb pilin [Bacillota bacterium]
MKKSTRYKKNLSTHGMGTVEVVIIIAILVSLALIFRTALTGYANSIMDYVFNDENVIGSL